MPWEKWERKATLTDYCIAGYFQGTKFRRFSRIDPEYENLVPQKLVLL